MCVNFTWIQYDATLVPNRYCIKLHLKCTIWITIRWDQLNYTHIKLLHPIKLFHLIKLLHPTKLTASNKIDHIQQNWPHTTKLTTYNKTDHIQQNSPHLTKLTIVTTVGRSRSILLNFCAFQHFFQSFQIWKNMHFWKKNFFLKNVHHAHSVYLDLRGHLKWSAITKISISFL